MSQLLMCLHVHHQLLTVDVCSVCKRTDTGKYKLDDMIEKIATGTLYDPNDLIPIYDAYNAAEHPLEEGCSAWRLRGAIHSRLTRDDLDGKVADVTLDENAPISLDSD